MRVNKRECAQQMHAILILATGCMRAFATWKLNSVYFLFPLIAAG